MNFMIRNLTHRVSGTGSVPFFGRYVSIVHNNHLHFGETQTKMKSVNKTYGSEKCNA
jgi:hypothetical protein